MELNVKLIVEERISKAGKPYRIGIIKYDDFEKEFFFDRIELKLLERIVKDNSKK